MYSMNYRKHKKSHIHCTYQNTKEHNDLYLSTKVQKILKYAKLNNNTEN